MIVFYITFDEIERGRLKSVLAAMAFFLTDFLNEIWNALFYKATGFAAVWQVAGPTAFKTLIGWNIEIMFMFFICGIVSTKLLPENKDQLYFKYINNRHVFALFYSGISVLFEICVHKMEAIYWNYWWWQPEFHWVFLIIGYLPFYEILFWVYDLPSVKSQVTFVLAMALPLLLAFGILINTGMI